jgi:biotin-(acetyl-CoA carboxylase) ligase
MYKRVLVPLDGSPVAETILPFILEIAEPLDAWARRFRAQGAAAVLAGWRDRDILTGRRVLVRREGVGFEGRVLGVNESGQLVVHDSRGEHPIMTEEIRVLD